MSQRYIFTIAALCLLLSACDSELPPADSQTPSTTVYLNFGHEPLNRYDTVTARYDPCKFFDGWINKATQVSIRVCVPSPGNPPSFKDIYPVQNFQRYPDFPSGNPNGIGVQLPETGGFVMIVTIYGEPDSRCCPGTPPGRVIYRLMWPYATMEGAMRVRYMLPESSSPNIECLYF